jgi:hypothetical protein
MAQPEEIYTDILYFGYDWDEKAQENCEKEKAFLAKSAVAFPAIVCYDAYDSVKGYRQEVALPISEKHNFIMWLMEHNFLLCSFNYQMLLLENRTDAPAIELEKPICEL